MRHRLWVYRTQKEEDANKGQDVTTIDVFVMDRCPDNMFSRKMIFVIILVLQGMMHERIDQSEYRFPMNVCLAGTYLLGRLSLNYKFKLYNKALKFEDGYETRYITGYNDYFHLLTLLYTGKLMNRIIRHELKIQCYR